LASQDFYIYVGDTRSLVITVQDNSGSPVNLTGATIKWVLVKDDQAVLFKDNQSNGGVSITNAANGQCTLSIQAKDTISLTPGAYIHEARMIDSSGNSSIIFTGNVTVQKSFV
jgi:hypothetical protein